LWLQSRGKYQVYLQDSNEGIRVEGAATEADERMIFPLGREDREKGKDHGESG